MPPHEQSSASDAAVSATAPRIVDWPGTVRRLRRSLLVIGVLVIGAWLALGPAQGSLSARLLFELAGFGLLASLVVEVVVVGGGAVRGLLAAGERGERLARGDVSLLPPQLGRRGR